MADVKITITIPSSKVDTLMENILYLNPVPLDGEGNPQHTNKEWVKAILIDHLKRLYHQAEIIKQEAIFDDAKKGILVDEDLAN